MASKKSMCGDSSESKDITTFEGWAFADKVGFVQKGDKVEYVWCKTCTRFKDEITRKMQVRGKVKKD